MLIEPIVQDDKGNGQETIIISESPGPCLWIHIHGHVVYMWWEIVRTNLLHF
jgi:hypothetical protein